MAKTLLIGYGIAQVSWLIMASNSYEILGLTSLEKTRIQRS